MAPSGRNSTKKFAKDSKPPAGSTDSVASGSSWATTSSEGPESDIQSSNLIANLPARPSQKYGKKTEPVAALSDVRKKGREMPCTWPESSKGSSTSDSRSDAQPAANLPQITNKPYTADPGKISKTKSKASKRLSEQGGVWACEDRVFIPESMRSNNSPFPRLRKQIVDEVIEVRRGISRLMFKYALRDSDGKLLRDEIDTVDFGTDLVNTAKVDEFYVRPNDYPYHYDKFVNKWHENDDDYRLSLGRLAEEDANHGFTLPDSSSPWKALGEFAVYQSEQVVKGTVEPPDYDPYGVMPEERLRYIEALRNRHSSVRPEAT